MNKIVIPTIVLVFLFVFACSSDETPTSGPDPLASLNLPSTPFNYANIDLPAHYTTNAFPPQAQFQRAAIDLDNTPATNPITDHGATLGRVLFYDQALSANGTVSCASCHQASHGFSDSDILSEGFAGGHTRRHSMGLVNARFYDSGKFFWDERAATLEEQVLMPFQDEVEMGLTLEELVQIAEQRDYYPVLFQNAFGDTNITSDRMAKALAQFVRSMVSTTSKYDEARADVDNPMMDFPDFTAQENAGKRLFFQPIPATTTSAINCASCHISEAFVGPIPNGPQGTTTSTNNGLDAVSTDDLGIQETTGNPNDGGKFKAPSLRNIAIRPPYMHDGRFSSLEEVIDHYSMGIQAHANLSAPLKDSDGNPIRLNLSQDQKDALLSFFDTLTDHDMLADEKYSDPFR